LEVNAQAKPFAYMLCRVQNGHSPKGWNIPLLYAIYAFIQLSKGEIANSIMRFFN